MLRLTEPSKHSLGVDNGITKMNLLKQMLLVCVLFTLTGQAIADSLPDASKKIELVRVLAERGDANAQLYLGMAYQNGEGIAQDYKEALKWYRLSAEQGDATAQYDLGFMYLFGQGVPQDYVLSHMWYNIAASNADGKKRKDYTGLRDSLERLMTLQQISEAQGLARKCTSNKFKGC
jgi:hypothetical protein